MNFNVLQTHPAPAQNHCGTTPLDRGDLIENRICFYPSLKGVRGMTLILSTASFRYLIG